MEGSLSWFHGLVCQNRHLRIARLIWLVVSTPLKNISQFGLLFPIYIYIYGQIKNVPNHQPVMVCWCLLVVFRQSAPDYPKTSDGFKAGLFNRWLGKRVLNDIMEQPHIDRTIGNPEITRNVFVTYKTLEKNCLHLYIIWCLSEPLSHQH